MENLEEAIRERAYQLWLADGRPEGNPDNYWLNAQRELLACSADRVVSDDSAMITAKPGKARVARPRKAKRSAA